MESALPCLLKESQLLSQTYGEFPPLANKRKSSDDLTGRRQCQRKTWCLHLQDTIVTQLVDLSECHNTELTSISAFGVSQ